MLIGRCAWHPHYFGRPRWNGVASWRGWAVRFTDGICPRCLDRFREMHRDALERRKPPAPAPASDAPQPARIA
jgi:hypothetical protein